MIRKITGDANAEIRTPAPNAMIPAITFSGASQPCHRSAQDECCRNLNGHHPPEAE